MAGAAFAQAAQPKIPFLHTGPREVPEITFQDAEGKSRHLSDFRGRVVLLNIWATWCAPCRQEMPTLDRLQARLGGADFEVVALSVDRLGIDAVRDFYAEIGVRRLSIYVDPSMKATRLLAVPGLPTTLLLDHLGREIGRLIGAAEWDAPEIVALLRTKIAEAGNGPDPADGA